jgi:hypothetical protein
MNPAFPGLELSYLNFPHYFLTVPSITGVQDILGLVTHEIFMYGH